MSHKNSPATTRSDRAAFMAYNGIIGAYVAAHRGFALARGQARQAIRPVSLTALTVGAVTAALRPGHRVRTFGTSALAVGGLMGLARLGSRLYMRRVDAGINRPWIHDEVERPLAS